MANRPEVQYIQFRYVTGAAAPKVQPKSAPAKKTKTTLPIAQPEKKFVFRVDPVALCGFAIACVLVVCMLLGFVQFRQDVALRNQMDAYVQQLQEKNLQLEQDYHTGYDLDYVRETALALGMVPMEEVTHIAITVQVPPAEPELTAWEEFVVFCKGLFA